eukprot:TRINITY_DN30752_c0_g1_i1.p1 TRINITY_DN30752_c0_g1~~TRINITY_DN30752_c0_g1_i1.p1  ORF type:complete len:118 (+),score=16.78 TRINITY_DN30752_c0_g1_i1:41-394(+)
MTRDTDDSLVLPFIVMGAGVLGHLAIILIVMNWRKKDSFGRKREAGKCPIQYCGGEELWSFRESPATQVLMIPSPSRSQDLENIDKACSDENRNSDAFNSKSFDDLDVTEVTGFEST